METFDTIIIGGGPAGSTCARTLVRGGQRVAVLDRAIFPRPKLCAGWVSRPLWRLLELDPRRYPHHLWEWTRCHVHYGGQHFIVPVAGAFIRRIELDDFLLRRSGATLFEGVRVGQLRHEPPWWIVDDRFRSQALVGAGGARCPLSRSSFFPGKSVAPVGTLEAELPVDPALLARHRVGRDGEPELLIHDDLSGYSWNIAKSSWINLGCGTADPQGVRARWLRSLRQLETLGHVPPPTGARLGPLKGHFYHLFAPQHLAACQRDGAYLVGDALGLAHPLTAEGIMPAVLSGRLCGEAILSRRPASYQRRLRSHPVIREYRLLYWLRQAVIDLRARRGMMSPVSSPLAELVLRVTIAHGFARLFSGRLVGSPW